MLPFVYMSLNLSLNGVLLLSDLKIIIMTLPSLSASGSSLNYSSFSFYNLSFSAFCLFLSSLLCRVLSFSLTGKPPCRPNLFRFSKLSPSLSLSKPATKLETSSKVSSFLQPSSISVIIFLSSAFLSSAHVSIGPALAN